MNKNFKEINFPATYKYSSDSEHIPLEFYNETFPVAKKIDLFLGYFSSNAIKVLSKSFAEFVVNGGEMRIITNHVYSLKDKENLIDQSTLENEDKIIDIFNDLEKLEFELSDYGQHFFDCLKYLQKEKRLIIQPVKFNNVDLAHCKKMILYDGTDYISTDGSINFTLSALTKNSESFEVNVPWVNEVFEKRVVNERGVFEKVINGEHTDYKHISSKNIEVVINNYGNDKDKQDLLEDSIKIDSSTFGNKVKQILKQKKERFIKKITELKIVDDKPHFPIFDGKISHPRPYQVDAYDAWVKNSYSGIFAMATGTGKTITALNCVLEEYKKTKKYQIIIVVPTIDLVNQWKEELEKFNYSNILQVSSKHKWNSEFVRYVQDINYGINNNIAIITTYKSFVNDKFYKLFNKVQEHFTLIADEAHNIGSKEVLKKFKLLKTPRKIALSATPKRNYDPLGTKNIEKIFNDTEPYTYVFSLERAIKEKYLTRYLYYPKIVKLNDDEFEEYKIITKKLIPFMSDEGLEEGAQMLLLKRKQIIHKARNKQSVFLEILNELNDKNKLSHAFVFAPEGKYKDNDENILNSFIKITTANYSKIRVDSFTSKDTNRADILKSFENGVLDIIFAMKALDEGVDIPRTEVGIFTSSTGNPRQYIQRRGRVLRKHPDKDIAIIYDMIVVPDSFSEETFNIERSLLKQELIRVGYFADLSENYYQAKEVLNKISQDYNLNLDTIITELKNDK